MDLTGTDAGSNGQKYVESASIRRRLEEFKDKLLNIESILDIHNSKKATLERELAKMVSKERLRMTSYGTLEKENHDVLQNSAYNQVLTILC